MSIFLALPRNYDRQLAQAHKETVEKNYPHHDVVLSSEDFLDWFDGNWNDWIRRVNSVDYYSRKPRYTLIVCVTGNVGRATSQIVKDALTRAKSVYLLSDEKLLPVHGIQEVDSENWQSGHTLTLR